MYVEKLRVPLTEIESNVLSEIAHLDLRSRDQVMRWLLHEEAKRRSFSTNSNSGAQVSQARAAVVESVNQF